MSHVATVDIEIRDLDALGDAAQRCGLELVRDQREFKWYGHSVGDTPLPAGFTEDDLGKCEHALRIPGNSRAYEIGVVRRRDGRPGFTLMWDFWRGGHGLQSLVGEQCGKLRQAYAIVAAAKEARRKGFLVQEQREHNGSIELVLMKGGA